jgi:hypothetical protein
MITQNATFIEVYGVLGVPESECSVINLKNSLKMHRIQVTIVNFHQISTRGPDETIQRSYVTCCVNARFEAVNGRRLRYKA